MSKQRVERRQITRVVLDLPVEVQQDASKW